MEQYIHQLSQFERKLVENHDLVTVRGKRGRPVPVLIPRDIAPVMALLCSKDVRVAVGVEQSPFLFASINNPTQTVVRAGESLVRIVNSITLECPEAIKSTNLRKYMATTIQVMSLNASQMEWVADHLGHSLNVERTYYRMMSSAIEKAKIAKLLILADSGCITQYHGKRLDELEFDDIPVLAETDTAEDACIVAKHVPFDAESEDVPVAATKRKVSHDPAAAAIQVDTAEDHINVEQNQVDADSEDVSMAAKKGKVSRGTAKWSAEESKHLHEQFSSHISNYIVPGKAECLLFLKRYKHKLYWKRVKDKVNSEIQKQRRRDK